ncbi:STAS domain-containing protein [Mesoaciditoga lauensis]|uniref:STAS domain-containing protein n=1 Tax=Mesoaciditoga lauensis TaxID=1495039 RepID=UPI00056CF398|nr:STAS domain-containing protein [Mesoaciditoga lauensis]
MQDFKIDIKMINSDVLIMLTGELDAYHSIEFKEKMMEIIKGHGDKILLDMTDLSYIDSAGLGALVSLLKRASENSKELRLFGLRGNVKKIFELTRLNMVFNIFDTLEEALS